MAQTKHKIELNNIDVTFTDGDKKLTAVKNVSLVADKGDVFGIVGYSGAGKSTLVRVINLLQRPSAGEVIVNGQSLLQLSNKELRSARRKIGMIFQHFNLMASRTIADNVRFPLANSKLTKEEKDQKVDELLELVGLVSRKNAYPSQLSGGQKQRVAIARALANDPEILISDEATSALDPKTTLSILTLLKELNQKLGLTIVLITHEMMAVKEICNKVAVMENGEIIERGDLLTVFSKPKEKLTQDFINTATQVDQALDKVARQKNVQNIQPDEELVQLSYVGESTDTPLIAKLYESYQVTANILFGNIEILQDVPVGNLIVILKGSADQLVQAKQYLSTEEVAWKVLKTGTTVKEAI